MKKLLFILVSAMLLTACDSTDSAFKRSAVGNPYEVLVVCTSGSSAFSKPSLYFWKFLVHILSKPCLENFEHNLTRM